MNQLTIIFYQYFFLLIGFFGGNLWGSFFSSFCLPPFFFIIGILIGLELLSYIYYKNVSYNWTRKEINLNGIQYYNSNRQKWEKKGYNVKKTIVPNISKALYLLKVGLVFGLFVDAFKVGS